MLLPLHCSDQDIFFPSNAFMASARSLHTFNRGKQLNCSLHAGLSPCRKPQKCRLWTSTQSRNCPSKRTRKQKSKPKTTQQKQEKHTTKTKTKQKRQREVGSQPAMGITCMMTSYLSRDVGKRAYKTFQNVIELLKVRTLYYLTFCPALLIGEIPMSAFTQSPTTFI